MKWLLAVLLAVAAWIAGFGYGRWYGPREAPSAAQHTAHAPTGYHCPMHPNYRSDKPGNCGICGMRLVPDDQAGEAPEGTIHVSADKQQLIGVKYGTAEYSTASESIRATGKVMIDETRVAKVQTRIEGWIEQVFVDFVGKHVEKGQPMLTVYSPEAFAGQQELLLALRSRDVLKTAGDALVAASRRRLELMDLGPDLVERVERTGQPERAVTIYAPAGGHVLSRNAYAKQKVTPETELYGIADIGRVWILADVFESEAPLIRVGSPASVTLAYAGGRRFGARVTFIEPHLEAATRTLKVRLEADNPGHHLKPEMFVDLEFFAGGSRRLTVPSEAVLDSGLRQTVFVDRGNGHLEPRAVRAGARSADRIEILEGLKAGERIVTSGAFLLDSEAQLRAPAASGHKHD